jgi:ATP-dependent RNA helicase RhlE
MSFANLGLVPELSRAVAENGYLVPTPIQAQAIPAVLAGRDVLAGAQTGTGKTAAFVLPILQKLGAAGARTPRALVLTPTRELAAQVAESARTYGKYVGVRTQVVFGGVSINPQIDSLRRGCDLLVATPGRLLDLAEQRALDLREVACFVLDEADRMLDMGFIPAIRRVIKLLPAKRQNLMFSATYSDEIRELASRILRDPAEIEVAPRNATADRVEQRVYRVSKEDKRHLLAHLIQDGDWHQVLVFTRTKHGANRLAQQLESAGVSTAAIHGNKSQGARVRALSDFKANKVTALVATEVAARGLDIKELPHVVNYELPNVPQDYVHRIGRTARAGGSGCAVSLVSADETGLLKDIERLLGTGLQVVAAPAFAVPPAARTGSARTSSPSAQLPGTPSGRHAQAPSAQRHGSPPGQHSRHRGKGSRPQHAPHRADGSRPQHSPHRADGSKPQHSPHRADSSQPRQHSQRGGKGSQPGQHSPHRGDASPPQQHSKHPAGSQPSADRSRGKPQEQRGQQQSRGGFSRLG